MHQQPPNDPKAPDFINARAALAACPVSAIRTLTKGEISHQNKVNKMKNENGSNYSILPTLRPEEEEISKAYGILNQPLPFPRPLSDNVWLLGHHSSKTFGAFPYLVQGYHKKQFISIMVDVPKFTPSAIRAVSSLLPPAPLEEGEEGKKELDYLFLTHVDDTAQHNDWKNEYPNLKRIFHSGDLGSHNWIGDETLEDVEILLDSDSKVDTILDKEDLVFYSLDGERFSIDFEKDRSDSDEGYDSILKDFMEKMDTDFLILHTPGHSPGSISLLYHSRSADRKDNHDGGTIFTGDTYAFSTRDGGHMTGFPRYGNDLERQAQTLKCLGELSNLYECVASGHGHVRDYRFFRGDMNDEKVSELKKRDIHDAVAEALEFSGRSVTR